jgi:hypothetical protein
VAVQLTHAGAAAEWVGAPAAADACAKLAIMPAVDKARMRAPGCTDAVVGCAAGTARTPIPRGAAYAAAKLLPLAGRMPATAGTPLPRTAADADAVAGTGS